VVTVPLPRLSYSPRETLEALDQAHANAVDDVLGQPRKQPRLQHAKAQGTATQGQGDQQHQADITRRLLPHRRQHVVHDFQRGIAMPSNTSSTSNGSSNGIGTLHSVASTATPLAIHRDFCDAVPGGGFPPSSAGRHALRLACHRAGQAQAARSSQRPSSGDSSLSG
jgi:hypothetical protein